MRVRALVGFASTNISTYPGQEIEITDKEVLNDLLSCGYVEEVKSSKRGVKKDESK